MGGEGGGGACPEGGCTNLLTFIHFPQNYMNLKRKMDRREGVVVWRTSPVSFLDPPMAYEILKLQFSPGNNRAYVSTRLLIHKHVKISVDEWIMETTRPHKQVQIPLVQIFFCLVSLHIIISQ